MPSSTRSSRSSNRSAICFEHTTDDGDRRRVRIDPGVEPGAPDGRGERITTSEPDARAYDDPLPRHPIPGTGEPDDGSGERPACGEEAPLLFCPECGEYNDVGSTCGRSRCSHCWESWAFHRVANNPNNPDRKTGIAAKLEQYRSDRNGETARGPFFHHLTVSFRPSVRFNSSEPLGRAFDAVKALLPIVNGGTGYLIYHPWRIAEEHRGAVRGHDSGDGDLTWKDVLGMIDEQGWETVRDEYLVFAPHFHVLTVSPQVDTMQTPKIQRETGVVVHRIEKESNPNISLYDMDDLAAAGAYSVSHAGLEPRGDGDSYRAAIRAFGEVAGVKAGPLAAQRADTAMRKVAYDVLGVDFTKPTCDAEQPVDADRDAAADEPAGEVPSPDTAPVPTDAALLTDGGRSKPEPDDWSLRGGSGFSSNADDLWENYPDAVPAEPDGPRAVRTVPGAERDPETETPPGETETCGGSLRPMYLVDGYLERDDWCETIPDGTLERLRAARDEWADLVKPKADEIPAPGDSPGDDPPD